MDGQHKAAPTTAAPEAPPDPPACGEAGVDQITTRRFGGGAEGRAAPVGECFWLMGEGARGRRQRRWRVQSRTAWKLCWKRRQALGGHSTGHVAEQRHQADAVGSTCACEWQQCRSWKRRTRRRRDIMEYQSWGR